jgi:hypothetical protein
VLPGASAAVRSRRGSPTSTRLESGSAHGRCRSARFPHDRTQDFGRSRPRFGPPRNGFAHETDSLRGVTRSSAGTFHGWFSSGTRLFHLSSGVRWRASVRLGRAAPWQPMALRRVVHENVRSTASGRTTVQLRPILRLLPIRTLRPLDIRFAVQPTHLWSLWFALRREVWGFGWAVGWPVPPRLLWFSGWICPHYLAKRILPSSPVRWSKVQHRCHLWFHLCRYRSVWRFLRVCGFLIGFERNGRWVY